MPDLDEIPRRHHLVEKLHARREHHVTRSKLIRALYVVAGFTILVAGLIMLVTPGPAFVVIPIGLGILALEFAWAEAMLERAILKGEKARRKAAETSRTQRVLGVVTGMLAAGAFIAWAILADIPLLPL
jgi:uncharacterized protein (TIGR02611 family)